MRVIYPFTAIVGQERMKRALILNAVDTRIGGVLIRGERGTAKSTAARALAALLPQVRVVSDCRFACDPDRPDTWCTECQERAAKGEKLPTKIIRTPFIDLPVSATEDRVVGTLNIEEAIRKGERHFEPGVLASANRGLLYIDEVNLLDDHVVDILLDSAAMGMNIVEREGISFTHPARFILVGTMNPEEGELRPQLLDRFGLSVEIHGITSSRERVEIMQRRLEYEQDAEKFREEWLPKEEELSHQIEEARQIVDQVTYSNRDLIAISNLTTAMNVEGHRADLTILKAARAQAAFEGRYRITEVDISLVAELALLHRMRGGPMQMSEMDADELHDKIEKLVGYKEQAEDEENPDNPQEKQESPRKKA